jgi:hypothetical protein
MPSSIAQGLAVETADWAKASRGARGSKLFHVEQLRQLSQVLAGICEE